MTGITVPDRYGFTTVGVDGPNVKVTFYWDADGDGHYHDTMDSFFIAVAKGGEQRVPSSDLVG